jgi:hypothetical protein
MWRMGKIAEKYVTALSGVADLYDGMVPLDVAKVAIERATVDVNGSHFWALNLINNLALALAGYVGYQVQWNEAGDVALKVISEAKQQIRISAEHSDSWQAEAGKRCDQLDVANDAIRSMQAQLDAVPVSEIQTYLNCTEPTDDAREADTDAFYYIKGVISAWVDNQESTRR